MPQIERNIRNNAQLAGRLQWAPLDWLVAANPQGELHAHLQRGTFDLVLLADCVWLDQLVRARLPMLHLQTCLLACLRGVQGE